MRRASAVDPITRDALARDYRALHDALKLTTIMVSHDMMEAILLADRIAVLEAGELVEYGATGDLLRAAHSPAVRHLMQMPLKQAERVNQLAAIQPPLGGGSKSRSDFGEGTAIEASALGAIDLRVEE